MLPISKCSLLAVLLYIAIEKPKITAGWIASKHTILPKGRLNLRSNDMKRRNPTTERFSAAADDDESSTKTLDVCMSPGCVADGAETTLLKLRALSSSCEESTTISRGVCCSLCGNGPVAMDQGSGKKHRKITNNQKILDLLGIDSKNLDPNQAAILEGIDLCLKGDQDFQRRNYKGASQSYAQGIEKGMTAAIAVGGDDPVALEWVVKALCNEGTCKVKTADMDGAILSAGTAYQLSQKRSAESLEVLQEAYQAKKQTKEELEALQALFCLYQEEEETQKGLKPARRKRVTPMEANKRRSLEFRLTQLEATVKS